MKNKMTIDRLAVIVQRELVTFRNEMRDGFARVDRKLNEHDKRFTGIEERLGKMDQEFVGLDQRLTILEARVTRLEEDVAILRRDMDSGFQSILSAIKQLRNDIDVVESDGHQISQIKIRLHRVEKKLGISSV